MIVFLISAYALLDLLVISPMKNKGDAQGVKNVYYENPSATEENKIENLRKINPEICGWIKIDDTNIDYPVLYRPGDTDFYLTHDYKKEKSRYGSITLDSRCCEEGVRSRNVILHGHHMKDGQMFANLLKFEDVEFCQKHPIIHFDTLDGEGKWKVFAIFKANTLPEHGEIFDYYITHFENKLEFNQYIKEVRKRSLIDFPADVQYTDNLLTLSTCSYERKNFRTVVMARKLRRNESEDGNVDKIKKAENPLMPDCYYR